MVTIFVKILRYAAWCGVNHQICLVIVKALRCACNKSGVKNDIKTEGQPKQIVARKNV
jgi:hypothetical protein